MCVVFTTPLFSFNNASTIQSPCSDYCTGVADTLEAMGKISGMAAWNNARNTCMDTSDYCKQ